MANCHATLTVDGRKVLVTMTGETKCVRNTAKLQVTGEIERLDNVRAVYKEESVLEVVLTDKKYLDSALSEIAMLLKEHKIHVQVAAAAA